MLSKLEQEYLLRCNTSSDINEHMPVLHEYAKKCDVIAEFGVRSVVSTFAFAFARPKKLLCVDINCYPEISPFLELCKEENIDAEFHQGHTLTYELPFDVDLLFIDTLHTYAQLSSELKRHHDRVLKYLIFHDTTIYGHSDEIQSSQSPQGLIPAIEELLKDSPQWQIDRVYENNNGLTILKRDIR